MRHSAAPCVPALREAVKAWRAGGYKGITDTTRELLNFWFYTDHRLPAGQPFAYPLSQKEAVETPIFVWEFALTGSTWKYLKVPQKEFEALQAASLQDLTALDPFISASR